MKILIADNDTTTRIELKSRLLNLDYKIVEAANGHEAWEALWAENPPRIAILNQVLPGMDGTEILGRLNENKNLPFIYTVIMITGGEGKDIGKILDAGAHDFLSKPVGNNELRSRVAVGERLVRAEDKLRVYAGELRKYLEEIKQLGITDYLTGVFNRRYFLEQTIMELERSRRYKRQFSIIIIDIDHFKDLNDKHGHLAGDEVLQTLTQEAESILRKSDLLARFGGEEFSVLLPETDLKGAFDLAERLRQTVETISIEFEDQPFSFTVSIGVTEATEEDETIKAVLTRADKALQKAKREGRNRTEKG